MRFLVTGSSGLLGRSVCDVLHGRGEDVIEVIRPKSVNLDPARTYVAADLADPNWTSKAFPEHVDVVIHLAQSRRFRDFPDGAGDVFGVNVHTTAQLLNYAVRVGATHFVHASSGGLYRHDENPLTENAPLEPASDLGFYLGSKAAAEILVQNYSSLLNAIILRPFFIYGPGQGRDMLIPRLYDNVKSGRAVQLDGLNGLIINPVHVRDAAVAVSRAAQLMSSYVINIAGPDTMSLRDIALAFGENLGIPPVFEQSGHASRSLLGSIDRMAELLHNPQHRLCDSINDVANFL
jgi:UDP-glucose 4-epimerase